MSNEAVVFQDSQGNTISNDPLYLAKQRLADAGVEDSSPQAPVDMEALRAQIRAEIEQEMAADSEDDETDQTDSSTDDDEYSKLDGKALKALAKERNIDIPEDVTKVGQLRELLRSAAADA